MPLSLLRRIDTAAAKKIVSPVAAAAAVVIFCSDGAWIKNSSLRDIDVQFGGQDVLNWIKMAY